MKIILVTAILIASTFISHYSYACSMCKITVNGKTIVGNNEDSWQTGSKIWFEKGEETKFGAAYVGYQDGFPQGGMNEVGLAFDGFAVHPRQLKQMHGKQPVTDPTQFIKDILQRCSTVDEVKAMGCDTV
jgi:penicillin V acylase-like amidase (Ntn superfamily)